MNHSSCWGYFNIFALNFLNNHRNTAIMKKKHQLFFAAASLCLLSACSGGKKVQADYNIIPKPNSIVAEEGRSFLLTPSTRIIYPAGNETMRENGRLLADYIYQATGYRPEVVANDSSKPGKNIILELSDQIAASEGYLLDVKREAIRINAPTEAGVFYGIQTLRKAIPAVAANAAVELTPVMIKDAPRFAYRGVHLDVGRHLFPVEFVKKYIDILALHNVNRFHWHLTEDQGWRIEIKKYPQLTQVGSMRKETVIKKNSGKYDGKPYGGYYTQDEIREIVDYANSRFITVIPEIDLPGHMLGALAAYPQFGCTGGPYEVATQWGVFDDVICPGNEEAMVFLEDVLTEVMELFPSEYIHVGGDECPKTRWKKCPKCQARIKKENLAANKEHAPEENLQSYVIRRMEKHLNQHGRRMIGWDEVLEGGLAPNATVMSWRGEQGGIAAAKLRHNVIMTPNTYMYFDYYQSKDVDKEPFGIGGFIDVAKVYSYEPLPADLTPEEQKYIIGCQANMWTEYMPVSSHVEYMLLPRLAALAEVQWTQPQNKSYDDFLQRMPGLLRIYDRDGYNYARHIESSLPQKAETGNAE